MRDRDWDRVTTKLEQDSRKRIAAIEKMAVDPKPVTLNRAQKRMIKRVLRDGTKT